MKKQNNIEETTTESTTGFRIIQRMDSENAKKLTKEEWRLFIIVIAGFTAGEIIVRLFYIILFLIS